MSATVEGRPRRWWRQLLLFVLMAVAIELYATNRILSTGYESLSSVAVRDPVTMWRLRPHMKGVQHVMTPSVSTNADGLRDEDIPADKPANEIRILCLGGSVTYGYGLRPLETFPKQLENLLQQSVPKGTRVRVINGGQPGYASFNGAALLEDVGERYKPDIVIAMFANNDLGVASWPIYRQTFTPTLLALRRLLFQTATYRCMLWESQSMPGFSPGCIDRNWGEAEFTVQGPLKKPWWEVSGGNLRAMHAWQTAHGGRIIFASEALRYTENARDYTFSGIEQSAYEEFKKTVAAVGTELGVPVVQMDEALKASGQPVERLFLQNDCVHPSNAGAAIFARRLADEIWAQGWLPGATPVTPAPAASPQPSPAPGSAGPSPR